MIPELQERRRPSDPNRDYCQWSFDMPVPPAAGALRTSALLFQSFEAAGLTEKARPICAAIQSHWGRFNTVWGVKYAEGRLSWEFYFYDYARDARQIGMTDLLDTLRDLVPCALVPDDRLPYFMFSIELTEQNLCGAPLDQIDIYMGNPGSNVSSGLCYGLTASGLELRNLYCFFDAATEREAIIGKITESIRFPYANVGIDALLWPAMEGVKTVVVANKRQRDSIYFSRIRVAQLQYFLDRLNFPPDIRKHLQNNAALFDHNLFDVGWDFDYRDGEIVPTKGSYYGLL